MNIYILYTIAFTFVLQKLTFSQPAGQEEDEEHANNRLKHYLQRFDIMAKTFKPNYLPDLQNLKTKFESSLAQDTLKEKLLLLETYTSSLSEDFSQYFSMELDKQYMNEDILIHQWYIQELLPTLNEQFSLEGRKFLDQIKNALNTQDLEEKFVLYTNATESLADEFWDFINGDPEPRPVLNVHLKFFHDYISYLLQDCVVDKYETDLRTLLKEVEDSLQSQDDKEKLRVLDIFDDMTSKFGKFLNEKVVGYEIYKFGE